MTERRFSDAEAAEIFGRAAEMEQTPPRALENPEGMTLAQLQEIGREAGLRADLVAAAARQVERQPSAHNARFLGLPIGVGRTIELNRKVSDAEWDDLVARLRQTFDAGGSLRYDGPFRQWSNGNLRVMLEPTATGHRVRFRTMNGGARAMMSMGLASAGIAGALSLVSALAVRPEMLGGAGVLALWGAVAFVMGAVRLPGWARRRAVQMEQLADGLVAREVLPPGESR
jgi:hypothetical protein